MTRMQAGGGIRLLQEKVQGAHDGAEGDDEEQHLRSDAVLPAPVIGLLIFDEDRVEAMSEKSHGDRDSAGWMRGHLTPVPGQRSEKIVAMQGAILINCGTPSRRQGANVMLCHK